MVPIILNVGGDTSLGSHRLVARCIGLISVCWLLPRDACAARGRLKMHDLKMQDWKTTDNVLANSEQNYGAWKMQDWKMADHVN